MASNNNGFAEALEDINTLLRVNKKVSLDVLDEAAKYFAAELKKRIKMSDKNKRVHLKNSLKVVVKNDHVSVEFEDAAWYWYLAEHGHKKANGKGRVKGLHFSQNTFDAEGDKIADIMAQKIMDRM
ncbi:MULTISPECIES: HK97 gp10 family phage protein [Bacillus]|uniref:HK97 gp10 family phage protein n=6 Tax=Bacillus thuringiensis TaxID=1428 RepID=A0AAP4QD11_BACTU|nr:MULTISPECIES: HK97 gp10 family phage protein [Bacillus]MCU5278097.1 HK97 gp10 family phage protein [Bacillus cereus]MEB4842022.1 HK97 gp10 family phage protein [Paenibacillus jamilae]AEA18614.1 Phage protein [Bacillus thuringiensis serovar chinensis CT-43]AFQ18745.1 Phage protein [Bacillus thuringiensis HD-771]AFV20775.1 phage protein [Bacillus thuringiensis Bt407]